MSKQMSRVSGVVAAMLFAVAAGSPARSQGHAKPKPTPSEPVKTNQSEFKFKEVRISANHVVASCNTTQGCKTLKSVCETLPKHTFATNEAGNVGVCADTTRTSSRGAFFLRNTNTADDTSNGTTNVAGIDFRPGRNQTQGKRRYASVTILKQVDMSTPSLNCEGAAICLRVKNTCATLGGTYKPRNDVSGSCRH
ncbi:MAG TPA: hypothetical protein VFX97_04920 [Pyrinomonadaceae bacterium]|nr:hypothetical protein [Pyrinomonadaceae bacterium]